MPRGYTIVIQRMSTFTPPEGLRVVKIRVLEDGSCEVTMEPLKL